MSIKTVPVHLLMDYIARNKKLYARERVSNAQKGSNISNIKTDAYCVGASDLLTELQSLLEIASLDPKAD